MKYKPWLNATHLFLRLTLLLVGIFLLSGCVQQPAESADATDPLVSLAGSTTPTSQPSATIVWFPATSTPTIQPPPLPTATQVGLSGIGDPLNVDQFSDPAKWTGVVEGNISPNRIILDDKGMVFALNQTPARLISLNNELFLENSYITVNVSINRCSGSDTYGVLFKAGSDAYANRLALNCKGEIRVEQLRPNMTLPLSEWVGSGDVPVGAPGEVRIGIWSSGPEIRIFLNDHYQFTLFDSYYKTGTIGFFSSSTDAVGSNIRFSGLEVAKVVFSEASPTPPPSPSRQPNPTGTSSP